MLWIGKNNKEVLFKDKMSINNRSKYLENSKILADLIKKAKEENDFGKYFLDKSKIKKQIHKAKHELCDMQEKSGRITEKRICRCMYYYEKNSDKCLKCALVKKYRNISDNYKVIDYEVPTKYVIENCGGIDVIIEDIKTNDKYAVEVKPKNSKETLIRMIAEIFTYTAEGMEDYQKAIAFFKGSKQEKDYFNEEYLHNRDFNYLLNQVTVFRISEKENNSNVIEYNIEILKRS